MVEESRKPFLRQVWRDHSPSSWHKLVGTLINRQEWVFLCSQYESTKKPLERLIINPGAFAAIPNVEDKDFERLKDELM